MRKAFHGLDVGALGLQNRHQATVDELAIHADRAGAALAFAAAFLGSGQVQIFAQHVEQALHRRHLHGARFAIDGEVNRGPGLRS